MKGDHRSRGLCAQVYGKLQVLVERRARLAARRALGLRSYSHRQGHSPSHFFLFFPQRSQLLRIPCMDGLLPFRSAAPFTHFGPARCCSCPAAPAVEVSICSVHAWSKSEGARGVFRCNKHTSRSVACPRSECSVDVYYVKCIKHTGSGGELGHQTANIIFWWSLESAAL